MNNPDNWIQHLRQPSVLTGFALLLLVGLVKALYVDNITEWIEYLKHPVVLIGFTLFLLTSLIKPLFRQHERLSESAIEPLIHKSLNFLFVLAFFVVFAGFYLGLQSLDTNTTSNTFDNGSTQINIKGNIEFTNNIEKMGDINITNKDVK